MVAAATAALVLKPCSQSVAEPHTTCVLAREQPAQKLFPCACARHVSVNNQRQQPLMKCHVVTKEHFQTPTRLSRALHGMMPFCYST